jgi:hypothetical protein
MIEAVVRALRDNDGVGGVAGSVFSMRTGPGSDAVAFSEGASDGGAPLAVHVAGLGLGEAFVAVGGAEGGAVVDGEFPGA